MMTNKLRNLITVTEWSLNEMGAIISYTRTDKPAKEFQCHIEPIELLQGLYACASIDEYTLSPHIATNNGNTYSFQIFTKAHKLSQWEAFNLVLRHELEFEASQEVSMLEIDTILKSLQ